MSNRRRGLIAIPQELQTNEQFSTKKEAAQRRTGPSCPRVPYKLRRNVVMSKAGFHIAKPLYFQNYVELSPLYNPSLTATYFEQVFPQHALIGEGSFGKVYRACSLDDNELYAVKRLKSIISFEDRYAEVKNNEKVGYHPNIVQFFMAWEEACDVYIQLEFCSLSLSDYGLFDAVINDEIVWTIMFDIASALHYLHSKNLIHLDVKPGNILMKNGYFKLTDFGILVEVTSSPEICKTLSDGDSKYLAVEILEGVYKPACDIFGLGISLLELVGNFELPSSGLLWQHLRQNLLPPAFYTNPNVSLGFKYLVEKMMHRDYHLRPTAKDLLRIPSVKGVGKKDKKNERVDYAAQILQERGYGDPVFGLNNNVVGTPPPVAAEFNRVDVPDYMEYRPLSNENENCMGRKTLFPDEQPNEMKEKPNTKNNQLMNDHRLSGLDELPEDEDEDTVMMFDEENNNPITTTPILRLKGSRRCLSLPFE